MRQLLQNMRDGKAVVEEVPVPLPRKGMALIQTAASLVSAGTERMVVEFAEKSLVGKARSRPDLVRQVMEKAQREGVINTVQAAFNRLDQPMALGYSSAGTIIALGEDMTGFQVGERVACAGGGFAVHAEYGVVPRNLLAKLPAHVDFESAAFATLGAIAMHGYRLAEPQVGERVAVIGMGLLGLLAAQIAAAGGCSVLGIDLDPRRVELARSLGLQAVARESAQDASGPFTSGRGFDVVLICADAASNDPVELAGAIARDRARVVAVGAVGLNIPRKVYYEKELFFINSRSYGPGRYDLSYEEFGADYPIGYVRWTEGRNLESVVELMAQDKLKVKPLITHRIPIEEAASAYEIITGKRDEPFLGVLLTYPQGESKVERKVSLAHPIPKPTGAVKLGVLGAGLYANATLLPAIKGLEEIELVGIASSGGLHAEHSGNKFGFRYASSSEDDILNDPQINTVAILTRHDQHAALVLRALEAGKHVFVEKPLAINAEQLAAVQERLAKGDPCLAAGGLQPAFRPAGPPVAGLAGGAQGTALYALPRQRGLAASQPLDAGPANWRRADHRGGLPLCGLPDLPRRSSPGLGERACTAGRRQVSRGQCLDDLHLPGWLAGRGRLPCQRRQGLPQGTRRGLLRRADRRAGRFPLPANHEGWEAKEYPSRRAGQGLEERDGGICREPSARAARRPSPTSS